MVLLIDAIYLMKASICKEWDVTFYFLMACTLFAKILKAVKMSFSTIKKSTLQEIMFSSENKQSEIDHRKC